MYLKRNKSTVFAIFLMFAMAISLVAVAIEPTNAIEWFPYITASPDPVGVGQRVLAVYGFTMPTQGIGYNYEDWTLTITDPDGNAQTVTGLDSESTGSGFYVFTPDQVGTWKMKASYPGGYVVFSGFVNMSVPAAETNEFSITVQEDPIPEFQEVPIPTDYWTYPVYGENRGWAAIAGDWLMPGYDNSRHFDSGGNSFNPYTKVPNTAHILWAKPQLFGGIVGGEIGTESYYAGLAYRTELHPPVIIGGRVIYNERQEPRNGFYCVDLRTGETLWRNNGTYITEAGVTVSGANAQITLGQMLMYNSINGHGAFPFLWSTFSSNWAIWDAWTGDLRWTVANAPPTTNMLMAYSFHTDESGTLYQWRLDTNTGTLALWNSTKMMSSDPRLNWNSWPQGFGPLAPGITFDWKTGISWNATLPGIVPGYAIVGWDPKDSSVIILSNQTRGNVISIEAFEDVAVSGVDGHILWRRIRNEGTWEQIIGGQAVSIADDTYVYERKETRNLYAYSVSTGEKKWETDSRPNQWGMYTVGLLLAYGNVYSPAYDGVVNAYDLQTGDKVWSFGPIDAGLETPYGVYPFFGGMVAADGKVFAYHGEHSADSPLYRGERMYILNATTGEEIWSISGWCQQPCPANGIILTPNAYDNRLYCFGKGPSMTTVQAPLTQITMGDAVTITGSVTDDSPGAKGTAAIADEYMSPWMEYLYMQKAMPTNATGVTVYIDVLDANGNYRNIGTTTSDTSGTFGFAWTPDIPGLYKVVARFAGSDSYGSSHAETYFNVVDAPQPTPAPTPVPQAPVETYFTVSTIAIIAAIAIIGFLILRKR